MKPVAKPVNLSSIFKSNPYHEPKGSSIGGEFAHSPGGESTGLNSMQSKQVNTSEFKNWFGNSKLVDSNGNPQVVYRGVGDSNKDTKGFIWVSDSKELASGYTYRRDNPFVMPLFVKAEKPFNIGTDSNVYSPQNLFAEASKQADKTGLDKAEVLKNRKEFQDYFGNEKLAVTMYWHNEESKVVTQKLLQSLGFDSIAMVERMGYGAGHSLPESKTWAVFSDTQIKSATGNNGKYNPKDNNITKKDRMNLSSILNPNSISIAFKANPNHWPKGSPESRGGEFAPKDTGDTAGGDTYKAKYDLEGIPKPIQDKVIKTVESLVSKYPLLNGMKVSTIDMDSSIMALSWNEGINLNAKVWTEDKLTQFEKEYDGLFCDTSMNGLITHELGHLLVHKIESKLGNIDQYAKPYKENMDNGFVVSAYATENISEWQAESFVTHETGKTGYDTGADSGNLKDITKKESTEYWDNLLKAANK